MSPGVCVCAWWDREGQTDRQTENLVSETTLHSFLKAFTKILFNFSLFLSLSAMEYEVAKDEKIALQ